MKSNFKIKPSISNQIKFYWGKINNLHLKMKA
jgi:hypothetical protein